jgi:hypothetical protein
MGDERLEMQICHVNFDGGFLRQTFCSTVAMSASSSGSLNSDFLEELRNTGLTTDEPTRKSPPKESAKPKRKSRPPAKSRGHAAKRKPINLDSLMDGIDLPTPPASPLKKSHIFGVPDNVAGIVCRVSDYLTRSLLNVMDEFVMLLTHLFSEPSEIWRNVSEFVESLKQAVRDELTGLTAASSLIFTEL